MTDTQWPRFEVFQKFAENEPHDYAGSVHAPDAELALLNARDVFVRRPSCLSLWVVPASQILARTAQELEAGSGLPGSGTEQPGLSAPYHVFQKLSHKGTLVHRGTVEAETPGQAMGRALEQYPAKTALVCWVFPDRLVTKSGQDEAESMFEPAWDKFYRQPMEYHTVALMRQIKSQASD